MTRNVPCLAVFLSLVVAPPLDAADDIRLGQDILPVFQQVTLRLDADQDRYTGSVRVELSAQKNTKTVQFHALDMELTSVELSGPGGPIAGTHSVGEQGVVTVTTNKPLRKNTAYVLDIQFSDDFNTDAVGLYRMEYQGRGYAFTQFEDVDGRKAFPMWDEPGFKFPYQLTISVPESHTAVTNTPVVSESVADGWRTTVFARSKPLPSYLLAIATRPLESVNLPGLGVPGRIYTVQGQSHLTGLAVEATAPILKALEAYFDRPYPYAKLDFIAIPEYWPGAMEHPGAVTYADRVLLVDPDAASISQRRNLARIISHELAHMWFGDLVTMQWWDDLWLNESFADWMGDKITDQVFPNYNQNLATVQAAQNIMLQDARPSTMAIRRPVLSTENLLSEVGLAYDKGKTVLGMYEQWMGPDVFRRGVVDYINANAWGNAVADDLWRALDTASGMNVSAAMATFIDQPGLPLITVEPLPNGKVRISQERFHNEGVEMDGLTWKVPVTLKYAGGGGVNTNTILLDGKSRTLSLEADGKVDWIMPNAGGHGYYRWSIPPTMLTALAENAEDWLSPRERIAFVGNASSLLSASRLSGGDYLRVLHAMGNDSEPQVVTGTLRRLDEVQRALVPQELDDAFAVYVRSALGPTLERYGLEASPGEDETISLARPQLISWLADAGQDPKVLAHAKQLAQTYMEHPEAVDAAVAGVALQLAAHHGNRALFDAYRERAEAARVPAVRSRYLQALGSFRDPDLRDAALTYALEGPLRPNEIFTVVGSVSDGEAGRARTFRWMMENYDTILGLIPPMFATFMPRFAGGCSSARVEAAVAFFNEAPRNQPSTLAQLKKVSDQVSDCVNLRTREGPAVADYLTSLSDAH